VCVISKAIMSIERKQWNVLCNNNMCVYECVISIIILIRCNNVNVNMKNEWS